MQLTPAMLEQYKQRGITARPGTGAFTSQLRTAAANMPKPRSYSEFYNIGSGWSMPEQTSQESAWTNSAYNPTQNDNGYTRFDPNVYGGGLERSKNFEAGAKTFARYQQLKPGQPGYDHARGALKKLSHNFGIDNWRSASPRQLFESFDLEMRGLQEDNQKENFKFGLVDAAKLAAVAAATYFSGGAAATYFGPSAAGSAAAGATAGAVGSTTSGVLNNNLSFKKVATGAALGGIGGYAKHAWYGPPTGGFNTVRSGVGPTLIPTGGIQAGTAAAGSAGGNAVNSLFGAAAGSVGGAANGAANVAGNVAGNGAFSGAAPNLSNGASSAVGAANAAGGSGVGYFTDLLGRAGKSVGGYLADNAGDLVGAGISAFGENRGEDEQQRALNQVTERLDPRPWSVDGPAGGASFSKDGAFAHLSPELQDELQRYYDIAGKKYQTAQDFDRGDFAQNYYDTLASYAAPQERLDTATLLQNSYSTGNRGGSYANVAGGEFYNALENADQLRRLQADEAGYSRQQNYYNDYFASVSNAQQLAESPYKHISTGSNVGTGQAAGYAPLANAQLANANRQSNTDAAFWGDLAEGASNAVTKFAKDAFGGAGNVQYTNPVVPYKDQYGGAAPDYKNTLYGGTARPASDPRFSGWS